MASTRSRSRIGAVLVAALAFTLTACFPQPPGAPAGVLDLGPLGSYGAAPSRLFANAFHLHSEPAHLVRLSISAQDGTDRWGGLTIERSGPGSEAVLPQVGEYASGVDGWSVYVTADHRQHEVTSLSITEISYGPGVDQSAGPTTEMAYPVTQLRGTFTFVLENGDEATGSIRVDTAG